MTDTRDDDTLRTSFAREAAQHFVILVVRYLFPPLYDRVHYVDGRRFRVRVEPFEEKTNE